MNEQALRVIAGAPDQPLRIGDVEIPCYVLEDETRVLVQRGMAAGMGMSATSGHRFDKFISSKNLLPFIPNDLSLVIGNPIQFRPPTGGFAYGYPAISLVDLCKMVLAARRAGALQKQQAHIAKQCETIIIGLANVGIIALVDEATGYQDIRDRRALHKFLDDYLLPERAKWAKVFPDEFYIEIFRLRGWAWRGMKVNRPQIVGRYTNDIVWDRLAPHIHEELKVRNPKLPSGHRRSKHHQWLTQDIGHPVLQAHLVGVMALMRAAANWGSFQRFLQRSLPKSGETMPMDLGDE